MNIFLHGSNIQFPIDIESKILDQINHLKFVEFLKGFNPSGKIW
jgi:hypothetical protein